MTEEMVSKIGNAIGTFAMVAFGVLLGLQVVRYFAEALGFTGAPNIELGEKRQRPLRTALIIVLAFVLSRLLFFLSALVYAWATDGLQSFLSDFPSAWVRWDAYHYIKLADQWYVNVGDDRYKIVFYPLYPLITRIFCLTGMSARTGAFVVSNLCLLGCGWAMHALVCIDQDAAAANRAVWLMMFSPLGFFFSIAYSESLFLLLCLLVALMSRQKRWFLAAFFGALCSATRALGILTAPIIFFSLLQDAWQRYSEEHPGARRRDLAFFHQVWLCVLQVLPVALGLVAYLALNYVITGDPFTFLVHQSEHWYQEFGSLGNTLQYSFHNAMIYHSYEYQVCLWIPQTITILVVLAVLWLGWKKQQAGDAAFSVLYYYCAIAPTWLLSGMRYLAAMYALYPLLALMTRKKWAFALVMLLFLVLGACLSAMYSVVGYVL